MSCLTRKLQQQLARYVRKRHGVGQHSVDDLRVELVEKGLCPTHVTCDQMREVMKVANRL